MTISSYYSLNAPGHPRFYEKSATDRVRLGAYEVDLRAGESRAKAVWSGYNNRFASC